MFHDLHYNGDKLRLRTGEALDAKFTSQTGFNILHDGQYDLEIDPTKPESVAKSSDKIMKSRTASKLPNLQNEPNPIDTLTPYVELEPNGRVERKMHGQQLYIHSKPAVHKKRGFRMSLVSFSRLKNYAKLRRKHTLSLGVNIGNRAPWMETAWGEKGVKEIKGATHNARVLEYSEDDGYALPTDDNEHPWCGAFVGWVMRKNDFPTPHYSIRSREWRTYGRKIDEPTYGCIAFKYRNGSSVLGHVTFIVGKNDAGDQLYGLGGNQHDEVNVMEFPAHVFDTFCVPTDFVTKYDWLPVYKGDFVKYGRQG